MECLMREQSPKGSELDQEHAPHVTLIQRFIAKSDLPKALRRISSATLEQPQSAWIATTKSSAG